MRKSFLFLLLPLLLVSCRKDNKDKIPLFHSDSTKEMINNSEEYLVNKLYESDFDSMIERKMSFPLFVYAAGCGSCDNFSIVMKDYIRQTKVIFPYITLSVFNLSKTSTPSLSDSALLFYENGKLIKTYDDILDRVFTTSDLIKIMNEYTYDTGVDYLSTSYTYSNSTVPFRSYHFTDSIFTEANADTPHDNFKTEDGLYLFLSNHSFSYSSLYDEVKNTSYKAVINVSSDIDNKKTELENKIGCAIEYSYQRVTYKNGLCINTESVSLS